MNRHEKNDDFQYRSCWTCVHCSLDIGHTPAVHICTKDLDAIGDNYAAFSQVCDDWSR